MHDEAAVDVQDPLAHVDVLLQEEPDVVGRFQEENVGGVGDEHLVKDITAVSVCTQQSKGDNDKPLVYLQCRLNSSWNAVFQQFTVYSLVQSLVGIKHKETEISFEFIHRLVAISFKTDSDQVNNFFYCKILRK